MFGTDETTQEYAPDRTALRPSGLSWHIMGKTAAGRADQYCRQDPHHIFTRRRRVYDAEHHPVGLPTDAIAA